MRLHVSEYAAERLDDIWDYYAAETSERAADRITKKIVDEIDRLLEHPRGGQSILVNVMVDQNAVIGTLITADASIMPLIGDAAPLNNHSSWQVTTTGSCDPNGIQVDRTALAPNEVLTEPDLYYMIRFQNTGTDTAFTVRVENRLPADLQIGSFQFVGASHPVQIAYTDTNSTLTFQFNNILLPDSNTNEAASHGHILYRIKPTTTLALGDSILSQTAIFFDFNSPVITNTAHTVIENTTGVGQLEEAAAFTVFPNPAKGSLLVRSELQRATLILADALGCDVLVAPMNATTLTIDVNHLPRGFHVITLRTAKGDHVQCVVLE